MWTAGLGVVAYRMYACLPAPGVPRVGALCRPPCCFSLNLSMAVKVFEGFRVGLETITPSPSFDGTAAVSAVRGGKEVF